MISSYTLSHCSTKCIYKEVQQERVAENTARFVSDLSYQYLGGSLTITHTLSHMNILYVMAHRCSAFGSLKRISWRLPGGAARSSQKHNKRSNKETRCRWQHYSHASHDFPDRTGFVSSRANILYIMLWLKSTCTVHACRIKLKRSFRSHSLTHLIIIIALTSTKELSNRQHDFTFLYLSVCVL